MGFNLSKNNLSTKAEAGYTFFVTIPETNERTEAKVTVRGAQSAKVRAYQRKKFNEMQLRENTLKNRGKQPDPMTLEEAEELAVEAAIVRIISWDGFTEEDDKGKEVPVPFTEENARRILTEHGWIREQILEESNLLTNFL